VLRNPDLTFGTPGEIARKYQPVSAIHVPHPISWADEEKDLTAWLGNELQEEAYNKLYALEGMVSQVDDAEVQRDWMYLQASDHFYYMCTKFFSDGEVHAYFNPYESPYDAFINYMNILSDFTIRVESALPEAAPDTHGLKELISEKEKEIEKLRKQVERLKKEPRPQPAKKMTKTPVKTAAKKTTSRVGRKTQPKKPK
jgi:alpha-amylase